MNAHDEIELHELAAPYALDALDERERAAFEAHLGRCEGCRRDVAELTATAGELAGAVAEAPPPELRAAVLAQVADTRQQPPAVSSLDDHRSRRAARVPRLLAAAAALVVVAGLATAVVLQQGRLAELEAVEQLATASDVTLTELSGPGEGELRLLSSQEEGSVAVVGELPPPGEGRTYQLWLIDDAGPASAGTFGPEGTRVEHLAEGDVAAAVAVGVTEEPAGGSPQPTGEILHAGELR